MSTIYFHLQAIKSKLADVNPAVEGIECANWSTQACSTFINLLNTNIKENLTAIMHHDPVDSNGYKVVLFNNVSRRNICVNSKLISLGHATTLDPGKCLFQKPNMRGLPLTQSTTEMNSRNVCITCFKTMINLMCSFTYVQYFITITIM